MRLKTEPLLLLLICSHVCNSDARDIREKIYPEKNVVKNVGEDVQLWCQAPFPAKNLSFYHGEIEFPRETMRVYNETTIELNLKNVKAMDISVICRYNGTRGIDMRRVIVGTPPVRPTDFQCLSYDFNYMECQFTKPHNFDKVKYDINYSVGSSNYDCPNIEPKNELKYVCNITVQSGKYRQVRNNYTFQIYAYNKLGNETFLYNIKHFDFVIPGKPDLNITNKGPNSAVMKWDVKKPLYREIGLVFDINIASSYDSGKWKKLDTSQVESISETEYSYKLRDLYAFTLYEVQLRLKVQNATDVGEMWSQTNVTFSTEAKKPDDPPTVDVGSFQPQAAYNASVTWFYIYWKGVPIYKQNARNLHYVIKDAKKNGELVNLQSVEPPTMYSAKFVLEEKADYEFTIYTANDEGMSEKGTVIRVPRKEYPLPETIRKILVKNGYILQWDQPDLLGTKLRIANYTVFSCIAEREIHDRCKSDFDFTHVSKGARNHMHNTTKPDEKMNFAISANYIDGGSSGMVWAMCTASENSDFAPVEPKGLPINGTTIKLDWSLECIYRAVVEGFRINYCPINVNNARCKEPKNTVNITGLVNEFYLTNLKPYTTYGIWTSMFSKNKEGPESDTPLEITTLEAAPSPPQRLTALKVTDHSIRLQWEQPEYHNGILTHYKIYYNNGNQPLNARNESIITFDLDKLSSYKEYKIYVTAHTTAESEPSNDISVRTAIGQPGKIEQPSVVNLKETSSVMISWKRPQVPSGPIHFYELKITIYERDEIVSSRIARINGTRCTMPQFQDSVCRNNWERAECHIRAVNVVPTEYDESADRFGEDDYMSPSMQSQFRCEEETPKLISEYHQNENSMRYLTSDWSNPSVHFCYYPVEASPTLAIVFSVCAFVLMMICFYYLSKKYIKMKDIGLKFPPGLTDLDQESGPKGCDNVISREDIAHSDESYKNEKHKLLDTNRMDSGYMNDGTDKSVTGEFDDSSLDAIRGEEDSSSSQREESVEMSDMSESSNNSPSESPNINIRENSLSVPMPTMAAPVIPAPQRSMMMKPIIINGYVQHDSFQSFAEPSIPYTSLDSVENAIIPTNLNSITDSSDVTKHKSPNSVNDGAQENICGYVTHKQLSEFGHRQQ